MIADDVAIMLFAYAKNEQHVLTREQRKAALEIMKTVNPEEQADPAFATAYFDAAIDITTPREPENQFGHHDLDAWENSMQLLLAPDVPSGLSGEVDIEALISNDRVEQYNDFDHDAVINQAEEFTP